jgi:hypothetical protein
MRRIFLQLLVGSLCLTALIAIVALVGGNFGDTDRRIVSNVAALATYSFCAFYGAVLAEKKPDHLLAKSTVVAAGIGFLLATVLIWSDWNGDNETLIRAMFCFLILSLAGGHASMIVSQLRDTDGDAVRLVVNATLLAISVLCLMLVYVAVSIDGHGPGDGFWRLLGVVAVLDVLGTLVAPVLRKLEKQPTQG